VRRGNWAFAIALAGLAGACLLSACSDEDITISKVFQQAPWTGPERYTYRVTSPGVDGEGRCTLVTSPEVAPGQTRLERLCTKDEFTDNGTLVAESATLRPISEVRVNSDSKKGRTSTWTIDYQGATATFKADVDGKVRSTDRDLPEPSSTSPDPGYYDDESLLWLARGIPLEDGYSAAYAHVINAGQPRILDVKVRVQGTESVKVPGGDFTAWKVRFERQSTIYYVWVDVAAPYRVVKARIEDYTYELTD
jgi:hypothetical protein